MCWRSRSHAGSPAAGPCAAMTRPTGTCAGTDPAIIALSKAIHINHISWSSQCIASAAKLCRIGREVCVAHWHRLPYSSAALPDQEADGAEQGVEVALPLLPGAALLGDPPQACSQCQSWTGPAKGRSKAAHHAYFLVSNSHLSPHASISKCRWACRVRKHQSFELELCRCSCKRADRVIFKPFQTLPLFTGNLCRWACGARNATAFTWCSSQGQLQAPPCFVIVPDFVQVGV